VKNAWETYGVARRGKRVTAARVINDGARTSVTDLLVVDDAFNSETLESGRLFFNVAERVAVVKKIVIKKSTLIDATAQVYFEMSQALLEPSEKFYFDALPIEDVNGCKRYLSIAYHRTPVDDQIAEYTNRLRKPSGFKLDAVALADGYLHFCRVEPGELQVIANVDVDDILLAVLYKRQLHAIGSMACVPGETLSDERAARLAGEMKMTLAFQMAELFNDGITVPISRLILSGQHAENDVLRKALSRQVSGEVDLPHFNTGYFSVPEDTLKICKPHEFLITLGLAVR